MSQLHKTQKEQKCWYVLNKLCQLSDGLGVVNVILTRSMYFSLSACFGKSGVSFVVIKSFLVLNFFFLDQMSRFISFEFSVCRFLVFDFHFHV